jgi:MFS transporter, ACS family, solute carrier family 17 (sodium-dependent inorganic phosphate cotransporter), other
VLSLLLNAAVCTAAAAIESMQAVPWRDFVTDKNIWSIAAAHMAHNWGLYVMLAWLPTYFSEEYHFSLSQSSSASVMPWVVGAVVGNAAGWGADYLINSGTAVRSSILNTALHSLAYCLLL